MTSKERTQHLENRIAAKNKVLRECMEAFRKNLVYACYKDEQVMLKAFYRAKNALKR